MHPQFKTLKLMSLMILFSTLILTVVNFIFNMQVYGGPGLFVFSFASSGVALAFALAMASLVTACVSLLAPKFFKAQQTAQADFSSVETRSLIYNWNQFEPHMFTATILRLATAEAIAIFGFVLALVNHAFLNMLPFVAVSIILQFVVGPFNKRGC